MRRNENPRANKATGASKDVPISDQNIAEDNKKTTQKQRRQFRRQHDRSRLDAWTRAQAPAGWAR